VTVLRIVRGDATPEELAAVIALVTARSAVVEVADEPAAPSLWARPALRPSRTGATFSTTLPLSPGPGAWRASALPL
jgi:hypothetical protein